SSPRPRRSRERAASAAFSLSADAPAHEERDCEAGDERDRGIQQTVRERGEDPDRATRDGETVERKDGAGLAPIDAFEQTMAQMRGGGAKDATEAPRRGTPDDGEPHVCDRQPDREDGSEEDHDRRLLERL